MPAFELGRNVHENVRALRIALGSATRELSRDDLATLIRRRGHPRELGKTTVERWEAGGEPDLKAIDIMAALAGCSFESFAKGDEHAAPIAQRIARVYQLDEVSVDARERLPKAAAKKRAGGKKP